MMITLCEEQFTQFWGCTVGWVHAHQSIPAHRTETSVFEQLGPQHVERSIIPAYSRGELLTLVRPAVTSQVIGGPLASGSNVP